MEDANEIWVKLGGDKGFKMTCNIDHPNSPINTCAFSIFEAPSLQRYEDEVDSLHNKTWRYMYWKPTLNIV